MTQRYKDSYGTKHPRLDRVVMDVAREFAARANSEAMGGRVRRRAGTMDPPPSTSCADERRGEGACDENDEDEDEDGRSISRGFI